MQDLKRLARIEKAKRRLREHYRRNPMDWLWDKLGEDRKAFIWSAYGDDYNEHEWDGDKDPLYNAWMAIANAYSTAAAGEIPEYRAFGMEAATGVGKTYMLSRVIYWFLDCFEDSLVLTTAPVQTQLTSGVWSELSNIMPSIKAAHPRANLYSLKLRMDDKTAARRSAAATDGFKNMYDGWMAMGYTAGAEKDEASAVKARGFHRKFMLIILEEASGMNGAVVTAFQNTCTGNFNYVFAVGNPSSKSDALHSLIDQPNVLGFRASAYDHPNIVLNKETIEGAVTYTSIKDRERNYGRDSRLFKAMVRGICPEQAYNSLIHGEWLDNALTIEIEPDGTYAAAGVDVAASENGDKAAVGMGEGNRLDFLKDFACPNATHLGNNLLYTDAELADKGIPSYAIPSMLERGIMADCTGIDSVGVGIATVECIKNAGYSPTSLSGGAWKETIPTDAKTKEPLWAFMNLRAQMYWEAREDLRNGRIKFVTGQGFTKETYFELRKELLAINYETNATRVTVEGKDDIKKKLQGRSPNLADAFVYWNWSRKRYRPSGGDMLPVFGG